MTIHHLLACMPSACPAWEQRTRLPTVYIGIDWSEDQHDVRFLDEAGEPISLCMPTDLYRHGAAQSLPCAKPKGWILILSELGKVPFSSRARPTAA